MKRIIKDLSVLLILTFILAYAYEHFTGNKYELFNLAWWVIMSISIGLSYIVDHILEKYFKMKF
jgi:hypothetical protein